MAEYVDLGPCIGEIKALTDNRITDQEIKEIEKIVNDKRKALEAAGTVDKIDQRMAELIKEEGNKLKLAAALQKKHTALTIIARDKLANKVNKLISGGMLPKKAILAIFEGTATFRDSVYAAKLAFERRFVGGIVADLQEEVPAALGLLRNEEFANDVLREMRELYEGGKSGLTKNADALRTAQVLARYAELSRTDLNSLGASIGKLNGWTPQTHNADKIMKVSPDEWAAEILSRLDVQKSFPDMTEAEIKAKLFETYNTIITGKDEHLTAKRKGEYTGPFNLAKSLNHSRVFHFKSADDWIEYNKKFGSGNVITAMINHQRTSATIAAEMQAFGPNPEMMLNSFLDEMQEKVRNDPKLSSKEKSKQVAALNLDRTDIGKAFAESRGLTTVTSRESLTFARLSSGWRAIQSMAKLGGMMISALGDMVTTAAALKYHGIPLWKSYHDMFIGMIGSIGRTSGNETDKHIAYLLGEGFDGLTHHVVSAAYAQDSAPGFMSNMMINFFKMTGATWWTDSIRAVGARIMSAHMGEKAKLPWSGLDDQLKFVLQQHGIQEHHWNVIRQAKTVMENGKTYLTPDLVSRIDDTIIATLVEGKLSPSKIARAKLDLEIALARFYSDEINFGVIETDAWSRRISLQGTQPGTIAGEVMRHIMQFKGWPIAFTGRVLGRAVKGQRTGMISRDGLANIGHIVAGLWLAGYASMTVKDYLRGYDRKKFINEDGSVNTDTLMQAALSGGAAGIYGDFIFGKVNNFGGGTLDAAVGPGIGAAADLVDLMKVWRDGVTAVMNGEDLTLKKAGVPETISFGLANTPFANVIWTRPIVDYMALNALREAANPGFMDRQAESRKTDYGQSLWHKQSFWSD